MGALHEGHLAHVRRARELGGIGVVSIFVNPLQFGAGEDLERYPRRLDADREALAAEGAELVFAPTAEEMYPEGPSETRVAAGRVGELYEGAARPGHFDGVLTVVAKLLNIVRPDVVTFGRKDAQQLFLVRRMVRELDFPVTIEEIPTVRETDGLARSSRNAYLAPAERASATVLSAALAAGREAAGGGVEAALAAARAVLATAPDVRLDYLVVVDPGTFAPAPPDHRGAALMLVAARVGSTRLIDNETLAVG